MLKKLKLMIAAPSSDLMDYPYDCPWVIEREREIQKGSNFNVFPPQNKLSKKVHFVQTTAGHARAQILRST